MTDSNSQDITEGEAGTTSTWILLQIADSGINIFSFLTIANVHLGRVVRKPVNINPGVNVNFSFIFSCLKMFFSSNVWCSLRLLQLKTEGQTR